MTEYPDVDFEFTEFKPPVGLGHQPVSHLRLFRANSSIRGKGLYFEDFWNPEDCEGFRERAREVMREVALTAEQKLGSSDDDPAEWEFRLGGSTVLLVDEFRVVTLRMERGGTLVSLPVGLDVLDALEEWLAALRQKREEG